MTRAEEWKPLLGFEGRYDISNLGRIKNIKSNRIVKSQISPQGYLCCSLRRIGETKTCTIRINRAIAQAFIPNPYNYPVVNHKDGNKLNNSIENLEWCTYKHNIQHSFALGLQTPNGCKLIKDDYAMIHAMRRSGYRYREIVAAFNLDKQTIYEALKRKSYLRWFSEEEFDKRVREIEQTLPHKIPHGNSTIF